MILQKYSRGYSLGLVLVSRVVDMTKPGKHRVKRPVARRPVEPEVVVFGELVVK